jgi:hypothetical protein
MVGFRVSVLCKNLQISFSERARAWVSVEATYVVSGILFIVKLLDITRAVDYLDITFGASQRGEPAFNRRGLFHLQGR